MKVLTSLPSHQHDPKSSSLMYPHELAHELCISMHCTMSIISLLVEEVHLISDKSLLLSMEICLSDLLLKLFIVLWDEYFKMSF